MKNETNNTTPNKTATFMMGLPGAGKSTVARERYTDVQFLDPDEIKKEHPEYDPKNPNGTHAWSKLEEEKRFMVLVSGDSGFVLDGTGTNSDALVRRMKMADAFGFHVELCYVRVALQTAIERNANRVRVVPEDIIRAKALDISTAFEICAPYAQTVTIIDNDTNK